VLAKTLYPDVSDPRIARRLEKKDFQWLMWITLIKCLQAYGRAMRAEDDRMVFYVLDDKFWELLKRNWPHIPSWFKEVVPRNRWPKKYQKTEKNA
jgi:Rad3-related DNA helicases